MKNNLLSLVLILVCSTSYSQVGIGTPMPSASSQLEVVAANKGVLIPRINLTGSTDATTIANGNVNSLLVFNTATILDVKPGYYYWYDNKWNRVAVSSEITATPGTVIYNPGNQQFSYIDATGTAQLIDISSIVKANETVTTLNKDGSNNGQYTYTSENATATTIDVVGDVINNASTIVNNPGFVTELTNIIENTETLTSLAYDATANTLTYTDEDAVSTTINLLDLVGDAETNTTLVYDAVAKTLTYNGESGTPTVIDLVDLVGDAETLTTLSKDASNNGQYTYTSENATTT